VLKNGKKIGISGMRTRDLLAQQASSIPMWLPKQWTMLCIRQYVNVTVTNTGQFTTVLSHTRMVVRECCKSDDESLWEWQNFTPATPKPLNRSSSKDTITNIDGKWIQRTRLRASNIYTL